MYNRIKNNVEFTLKDAFGWRTKRQIVVIESDDWGTIRMASSAAYSSLLSRGVLVDQDYYCQLDALESEDDLTGLFEVLSSYTDKNDRHPTFTANCLMGNPDFEKIKQDDFAQYHFQPVQETFAQYPKHRLCFSLWKEGFHAKLFHPQFHGREHVNVGRWMEGLQRNLSETKLAFEHGIFGVGWHASAEKSKRPSYLEALAANNPEQLRDVQQIVTHGLRLFKENFGYAAKSFIAPNYVWNSPLEKSLVDQGVKFIQGQKYQHEPVFGMGYEKKLKVHYSGQENKLRQRYLVRNCVFEPSSDATVDWVDRCLTDVSKAFRSNRPAVISSHRVNYIGFIKEENRTKNIKSLHELLQGITRKWPEVEFLTTDELGELMLEKQRK